MWRLRSRLRALFGRRPFEDGMAEEMRFHIEAYTEDLVRSGVPAPEAARRARAEFGSVDNVKTDCREARGLQPFDDLGQNVRHALRRLARTSGFTATALATLALCLGANLAVFAVVDAVLLRPLPFPAPDRLVSVFNTYPKAGVLHDGCSLTNYYERRGTVAAFAGVGAYREHTAVVGPADSPERVAVARVSPDFFTTLGVAPALGRVFSEDEMTYQTDDVAVLTDAYWRQRLAADPDVIGKVIRVEGAPMRVVGVLPPQFSFLSSPVRVYFPLASNPEEHGPDQRHSGNSDMIARLRPGVSLAEAQAEIDRHNAVLEVDSPQAKAMADAGFRSVVVPLHADHVAPVRATLLLLQAGALFLLLIGAVNLVNLLLIRASSRVRELAVRRAIGARTRHVVGEVMAETLLLAGLGGLLGLAVGAAGIPLLRRLGAELLPLGAQIAFDGRAALAGLAAAVVLGAAMGLPVGWYSLRDAGGSALQVESRTTTAGRAAQRLRHGFVVAQIALAFVLLSGAGLLGLSLRKAMALSPGFRAENVLTGQVAVQGPAYRDLPSLLGFSERLRAELARQPGVIAAGVVTNVPFSGNTTKSAVTVIGHTLRPGESLRGHYSYSVDGDFFAALGYELRAGRFLGPDDSRRAGRVCVVDADFARRYWPGGGAIGQRLFQGSRAGNEEDAFTVVGVVAPAKQAGLTEDDALGAVYYPLAHRPERELFLAVRTGLRPESMAGTLRLAVRAVDPGLPLSDVRSMETRITDSLVTRRSPALLAGLFSAVALLLTAIGTYGVLSYAVAQRRREIGLRMALGARPEQVRSQFVGVAARLLALGLTLGLVGAWAAGQALQAILFQVPALHAAILAGTAAVLGIVALAACLLPSRRAARISPVEALAEP